MSSGGLLRPWARLFRLPLAPTAAMDSVACLAFALAAADLGVAYVAVLDWAVLAATSLLLYLTGMSLNDLADRHRDRELAPDRPLPSGQISVRAAGVAVVVLALGAIALGGGRYGSREAVIGALVFAFLYDLVTKHRIIPGAASMGLVRFANASIGVWPLVATGFAPAWTLLGPGAIGLYSSGVTLLSTLEEEEGPARRGRVIAMRVLASMACLLVAGLPWLACGHPTLGVLIGGGLFTSIAFARRPKKGPVKRQVLEMLLGLYFVSMCLATAADGGSLLVNVVAFVVAMGLIWLSQRLIFALR